MNSTEIETRFFFKGIELFSNFLFNVKKKKKKERTKRNRKSPRRNWHHSVKGSRHNLGKECR
jgi:polyphosphate kinase 2 (PPK2 family)